jgi:hypothetical protein
LPDSYKKSQSPTRIKHENNYEHDGTNNNNPYPYRITDTQSSPYQIIVQPDQTNRGNYNLNPASGRLELKNSNLRIKCENDEVPKNIVDPTFSQFIRKPMKSCRSYKRLEHAFPEPI